MTKTKTTELTAVEIDQIASLIAEIGRAFSNLPYSGIAHLASMPTTMRLNAECEPTWQLDGDPATAIVIALTTVRDNLAKMNEVLTTVANRHRWDEAELAEHRQVIDGLAALKRLIG